MEAAVQSQSPRKGEGERRPGASYLPLRPCAQVRVLVTPAEDTGSVFTEADEASEVTQSTHCP